MCDYIAGMTDNFAVKKFEEIFIPQSWKFKGNKKVLSNIYYVGLRKVREPCQEGVGHNVLFR